MENVNFARLKNCMRRARQGETLVIGFIGGSITQGSLATSDKKTYAYHVYSWWCDNFPDAEFELVNAGIGGTTSHYGVARVTADLLINQPDFVVVDFTVNDEADLFFEETYEGLIRRILSWRSKPAILILNNAFYDSGINAQKYHNLVGDRYKIPHVSVKDTICRRIKAGEYLSEDVSPDGLHPNDKGHWLIALEIIRLLDEVKEKMWEQESEEDMPAAVTENAYEAAVRMTNKEISPELDGFVADREKKNGMLDHFKEGWIGKYPGDRIAFQVDASCIAVQYRKTIDRPAVRAMLILDGDAEHSLILDGNFDEDWGDCLYLETVIHHGEAGIHTVEIEILNDGIEGATPFYLMSLIIAK